MRPRNIDRGPAATVTPVPATVGDRGAGNRERKHRPGIAGPVPAPGRIQPLHRHPNARHRHNNPNTVSASLTLNPPPSSTFKCVTTPSSTTIA